MVTNIDNSVDEKTIYNIKRIYDKIFKYCYGSKYKPDCIDAIGFKVMTLDKIIRFKPYSRIEYLIDLNNNLKVSLSAGFNKDININISDLSFSNLLFVEDEFIKCEKSLNYTREEISEARMKNAHDFNNLLGEYIKEVNESNDR